MSAKKKLLDCTQYFEVLKQSSKAYKKRKNRKFYKCNEF